MTRGPYAEHEHDIVEIDDAHRYVAHADATEDDVLICNEDPFGFVGSNLEYVKYCPKCGRELGEWRNNL